MNNLIVSKNFSLNPAGVIPDFRTTVINSNPSLLLLATRQFLAGVVNPVFIPVAYL